MNFWQASSELKTKIENINLNGVNVTVVGYFQEEVLLTNDGRLHRVMSKVTILGHPEYDPRELYQLTVNWSGKEDGEPLALIHFSLS